jgi:hypothetical protein
MAGYTSTLLLRPEIFGLTAVSARQPVRAMDPGAQQGCGAARRSGAAWRGAALPDRVP